LLAQVVVVVLLFLGHQAQVLAEAAVAVLILVMSQ
jgi:hypothetical protein